MNWAQSLPIVKSMKNRRYYRGIGRSPFKVMLGRKMKMGKKDRKIPSRAARGFAPVEDESFPSLSVDEEVYFSQNFYKNFRIILTNA